ncbi:MAG TPA: hypothetical protein VFR03_08620 [Thermoanaerobaculia bacterium]|nr:hypothetical protein [Thermoanaerobaculia bacterium]
MLRVSFIAKPYPPIISDGGPMGARIQQVENGNLFVARIVHKILVVI